MAGGAARNGRWWRGGCFETQSNGGHSGSVFRSYSNSCSHRWECGSRPGGAGGGRGGAGWSDWAGRSRSDLGRSPGVSTPGSDGGSECSRRGATVGICWQVTVLLTVGESSARGILLGEGSSPGGKRVPKTVIRSLAEEHAIVTAAFGPGVVPMVASRRLVAFGDRRMGRGWILRASARSGLVAVNAPAACPSSRRTRGIGRIPEPLN